MLSSRAQHGALLSCTLLPQAAADALQQMPLPPKPGSPLGQLVTELVDLFASACVLKARVIEPSVAALDSGMWSRDALLGCAAGHMERIAAALGKRPTACS